MENNGKQLPDVFNELKELKKRQVVLNSEPAKKVKRETQKDTFNYDIFQNNLKQEFHINHKFNAIGAITGILIFVLFITTVKSNYIFATSKEKEKRVIGIYEENTNPINLLECISENISEIEKKEIVTETVIKEREIEYIEHNQLPKNEQVILEEGKDEHREITYVRTYQEEQLVEEAIISDNLIQESSKAVVYIGTSNFLFNTKTHIGDILYTNKEVCFYAEPRDDSEIIGVVSQYIDFKLLEVHENWCKVSIDGIEGFIEENAITSEHLSPGIVDKCRIKRAILSLSFDMNINQKSGLTREDFVKIFSGNINDVYNIFENNAGLFYDIEQKYNINGIFLAAMGIHESNWGTSSIAKDKKNLFGYGAYDSSPYDSAITFESYEFGIELLAEALTKYYINPPGTIIYNGEAALGTYYSGSTISGVNVRYASDQNWSNSIYQIMVGLYEKLEK